MKANVFLTLCILIGGIAWYVSDHGKPAFSKTDISSLRDDIRAEFSKRNGVHVTDVNLVQESQRRVQGFVKLKVDDLGEITKDCTAVMSIDDGQSVWGCR
ncbi:MULTISPECIES: hypothetical protein [unclassified Bradyrhizobium]|uniref:hypothetical protein n=1 Tax=unclassified Bradyrhizobium TaxID=2631580 RepID=UPI001FF90655|nr:MULTISPECIES: hypothetical protein [unclassified Bradyrhizobium]MCK1611050.1 hypothetical protein [Bradyrhizobium sp. 163]MCK1762804.1 hypothetical protein [Bradyrhizobium sp. 136]